MSGRTPPGGIGAALGRLRLLWRLGMGLLFALCAGSAAFAHETSMAELTLRETARGEFVLLWSAGNRGNNEELVPRWPAHCRGEPGVVRCGEQGLAGRVGFTGIGAKGWSALLLKVQWLDGQSSVYTLTTRQDSVQMFGAADDSRGMGEIASAYALLGVEHILSGIDHLLFVIGLLFLVGFERRLIWTITAFTAAHSITLALGALHLLTLRSPPVEATIALSILLVAGEALQRRGTSVPGAAAAPSPPGATTLSRRWPALVAFLFGLVHGLGFAGALEQVGLPQNHLAVALLTFNLGVELGQLLVVALAWAVWRALRGLPAFLRLRVPVLYGIGGLAAYWTIARVAAIGS